MNPEVKQKWIAALRSGEYEQGNAYLHTNGLYCCLGVLSDLAAKAGVVTAVENDEGITLYDEECSIPPTTVARWAGLGDPSPRIEWDDDGGGRSLWSLNDHDALTFDQIADLIEEHF